MDTSGRRDLHLAARAGQRAARANGPQEPTEVRLADGGTVWVVTRPADLRQVMSSRTMSRHRATVDVCRPWPAAMTGDNLLGMDDPRHAAVRRAVAWAFTPQRAELQRPAIRAIADDLVAGMVAAGPPAEFNHAVAVPLPARVITEILLDVPEVDPVTMCRWADLAMSTGEYDQREVAAALTTLRRTVIRKVVHGPARGADTLVGSLTAAVRRGELSVGVLVTFLMTLFTAGIESTISTLGHVLVHLLRDGRTVPERCAGAGGAPAVVEEALGAVAPATIHMPRVAVAELRVGGITIPAGAVVMPVFSFANRTERRHLTFGYGPHFCLGAHLARVELEECLAALAVRVPGLRLACPPAALRTDTTGYIDRYVSIPVTW